MSIRLLVALCLSLFAFQLHAESIRTQTGYYYPVGNENLQVSSCGRWLTKPDRDYDGSDLPDGCYPPGDQGPVYHIGVDLIAGYGTSVRAIADGKVKPWSGSGWGTGNVGLLIEHESAEYGSFTALYGHIRSSDAKSAGSVVRAGETIGKIGHWSNGDHLHFGIVHPELDNPIASGYGMWPWNKYGFPSQGYYDNGLIDPIDFIVHSGPDNYMSRIPYVIPNPITTESAWFYDLCYIANTPDPRCSSQSIQFYFECASGAWPFCSVDSSVWSAVGESGLTSADTYGVGGDGYIPPSDPEPNDPVNLTQDTDIMDRYKNYEHEAGEDFLLPGMLVKVQVQVTAEGGDAGNWRTENKPNSETIDIAYYVSLDDGEWIHWETGNIKIGKLDEDKTIQETKGYTIPDGINSIAFRAFIDYQDEVEEYDEGDNESRVERFEVSHLRPDLAVAEVYLTDTNNNRFYHGDTVLEDQDWTPRCTITNIGEIESPAELRVEHFMDGNLRDTNSLAPYNPLVGYEVTKSGPTKWKLGDTGQRVYSCCVGIGRIPELTTANNCKSMTLNVVSWKPDLIAADATLRVNGHTIRNGYYIPKNSIVHPYCTVRNQGNRDVPTGFRLDYQVNRGKRRGDDGIDAREMRVGDVKTEYMSNGFRLGDTGRRSYQCCVDYKGEVRELNEGNNCRSMDFYVTKFPTSPDGRFVFSYAGPVSGMHCTRVNEGADPHTWGDNYFCSFHNHGIRWRSAGPINGMRCTQIKESADPHTWHDNYLCVPNDSAMHFRWSSAGPISGKRCVQWVEPAEPSKHTWNDNYLCY